MALQVWLPLLGNVNNQGLSNVSITNNNASIDNNGKIGKCLSFNGTSSVLHCDDIGLDTSKDYTLACWFYLNAIPTGSNARLIQISVSTDTSFGNMSTGIVVDYLNNGSQGKFALLDGGAVAYYNYNFVVNTWYHVTYTKQGNTKKLYLNGELLTTLTFGSSIRSPKHFYVGGTGAANRMLNGKMNDVRVYDSCLSDREIEILSRGLVCHYPLEGANNTLLPFGYQQLEYIESSGASAFDTKYKFNPEIDSIKMVFKGNDVSNNGMLFGQSARIYFWLYYYGNNGIRVYADNGNGQQSIAGISSDLNKHTAEYKNKHYYIDGTDKGSLSNTYAEQTTTSWICSYGSTSYGFKGRIYYAQIGRNGKVQRTFIPAKRLSDSKIGMYELNTNEFFPSGTSTAFTAGDVIGTPSTVYDTSGFKNNGETYAYDTTGSIECSSDTARYSLSTFINSANVTNNTTGIRYIYGNCELTTPQYLTVTFWCKPIAGYGGTGYANNGIFALTNNDIGTGAATDFNTAPMHNRDADIDMCTSTNVHKTLVFTPTANEWHHYAVVYDGRYGRAYKDGVQTATLDMGSNLSLSSFKAAVIGYSHAGGVYRKVRAYYSDFRIYATALSAEQVAELYNTAVSVANNGTLMGYELVEV